ncbi:MAG: alanine racemase [Bacteroidota bacterium]
MILQTTSPQLVIDQSKCLSNIQMMVDKAKRHDIELAPHFKTHQSHVVGGWMKEAGVRRITVTSVRMAEYFANDWHEILVAMPVNVLEHKKLNQLASKIQLDILAVDTEVIRVLSNHLTAEVGVWVEIDSGGKRTGVRAEDYDRIEQLITEINDHPFLTFKGIYSHAGQSYSAKGAREIINIHEASMARLRPLKQYLVSKGHKPLLRIGDSPTCSVADDFEDVDIIGPGNFVFYDLMQTEIGSCQMEQVSVVMVCPVIAKNEERQEVIIHGGAVHFSKDALSLENGSKNFGQLMRFDQLGWSTPIESCYIKSLSQEHGVLSVTREFYDEINTGDLVCVLPVHSCLTAEGMRGYVTLEGNTVDHLQGNQLH